MKHSGTVDVPDIHIPDDRLTPEEKAKRREQQVQQLFDFDEDFYLEQSARWPDYEEYEPEGRFISDSLTGPWNQDTWYHLNGVPQIVSTRNHQLWLPFTKWMLQVARIWYRKVPVYPLNPATSGPQPDQVPLSFFTAMRARLWDQRQWAFWSRIAREKQILALTYVHDPDQDPRGDHRSRYLIFSLVGLDTDDMDVERYRRFIRSDIVKKPFFEFYHDYLRHHPKASNPKWRVIQPGLSDSVAALRAFRVGAGRYSEKMDRFEEGFKDNWSYEDHAMRFILTLYHLAREDFENSNLTDWDATGFQRYFFSTTISKDMQDRHWFGYSLLTLLILSFQYHQSNPLPNYVETLVPALQRDYIPHPIDFPNVDVGMVSLSLKEPWHYPEKYEMIFDFVTADALGLVDEEEEQDLYAEETITEINDYDGKIVEKEDPDVYVNNPRRQLPRPFN
ncbi:hypothetical protein M426DRAFT_9512 [Hypoxylon sp. CI-4A]|nr:hypothetical protein M426DRAFT_9512 [Hypoxylon sp. CI-4A]